MRKIPQKIILRRRNVPEDHAGKRSEEFQQKCSPSEKSENSKIRLEKIVETFYEKIFQISENGLK